MKLLALLFVVSCAQVTSLNLKKHQFGLLPTKVIWFQVAGLEEEQIAMLRFQQTADKKTSFENAICLGQSWSYNLFKIRNTAESTFLSQITGKKNVKGTCEDASLKPIWQYVSPSGYRTAILETGTQDKESLGSLNNCQGSGPFTDGIYYFSRSKPLAGSSSFHYAENFDVKAGGIIFDRSCGDSNCGSSITDDVKSIYEKLSKISNKHFFIIRDFSYLKALEKKDIGRAKEILLDLERAFGEALRLTNSNDYLILLTTGDSRFVDLPEQGKSFYEFEKENKNVSIKRTKLTNLVLASGARAENFCGIYEDSDVFARILSGPKQQGLELQIINPFK
jgi:hypothetical protein